VNGALAKPLVEKRNEAIRLRLGLLRFARNDCKYFCLTTYRVDTLRLVVRHHSRELLNMNFSSKAIRFIVEALEYRIEAYQKQLETENLNDDEVSDITNDMMFLESLSQELNKELSTIARSVF
jgi:hypothetical protein